MSEQQKMDQERADFEAFIRSDKWLYPVDLTRNTATGDYWDLGEQCAWDAWQKARSLPVGVPAMSGEAFSTLRGMVEGEAAPAAQPAAEHAGAESACKLAETHAQQGLDGGAEVEQSAPGEVEEVNSFHLPDSSDCYGFGYVDGTCIQSLRGARNHLEDLLDAIPGEPLMTVAQHKRIVAQLAARDAGVVQVPVETLRGLVIAERDSLHGQFEGRMDELRALLAQRERGGE